MTRKRPEIPRELMGRVWQKPNRVRWGIGAALLVLLAMVVYTHTHETAPHYQLGDVAEKNIKAVRDTFIEDVQMTELQRQQVRQSVRTVYDHDTAMGPRLVEQIEQGFTLVRAQLEVAALALATPPAIEPLTPDAVTTADQRSPAPPTGASRLEPTPAPAPKPPADEVLHKAFADKLGIKVSQGAFGILRKENFPASVADLIIELHKKIMNNGVVDNKAILLRETENGIVLRDLTSKAEKIDYNLKHYYGHDQAKAMVRILGQPLLKNLDYATVNLVVELTQDLIQPNITLNRKETEERIQTAVAAVNPVLNQIKAGEMILREGERVTNQHLIKLKALQIKTSSGSRYVTSIGTALIVMLLMITGYVLYMDHEERNFVDHDKQLLFMTCLLVLFFLINQIGVNLANSLQISLSGGITADAIIYGLPIASGAMLVCLFLGTTLALPFAALLALSSSVVFHNRFDIFIYLFISCTMGAYWTRNYRERTVCIKAGAKLGLLNALTICILAAYTLVPFDMALLWKCIFGAAGGLVAGILTAGLAPFAEFAFNLTSNSKLLELANLDQPILRRLMLEAPGTYHHSVIVGTMVEAAATEIGSNPLLAKVCGYYHDIGKSKHPLYFIENQRDGKNRHTKLAPSMSSLILIAHLKNGVEIATAHKLGKPIVDTIRQHHGTSLIQYFYDKAKQLKGEENVKIDDFHYPGPKPQSVEAGLVMLADVVEAASRTLDTPTPSKIQGLVQRLINKVFSDGQLEACELTLKDLNNIAKAFNKILNGIYHHRIEYPDQQPTGMNGKGKNGHSDRQSANPPSNRPGDDKSKGQGHLKRLGIS